MNKVLPFIKGASQDYSDVPDTLKWAVPIYECLEKPEVKRASAQLAALAKQEVDRKMKARKKASLRMLSKIDSKLF